MESTNKSGKFKKKWLPFDDVAPGFTFNRGKEACKKSKDYIMSLKASPFKKFENKKPKSSLKNLIQISIATLLFGETNQDVIKKGITNLIHRLLPIY